MERFSNPFKPAAEPTPKKTGSEQAVDGKGKMGRRELGKLLFGAGIALNCSIEGCSPKKEDYMQRIRGYINAGGFRPFSPEEYPERDKGEVGMDAYLDEAQRMMKEAVPFPVAYRNAFKRTTGSDGKPTLGHGAMHFKPADIVGLRSALKAEDPGMVIGEVDILQGSVGLACRSSKGPAYILDLIGEDEVYVEFARKDKDAASVETVRVDLLGTPDHGHLAHCQWRLPLPLASADPAVEPKLQTVDEYVDPIGGRFRSVSISGPKGLENYKGTYRMPGSDTELALDGLSSSMAFLRNCTSEHMLGQAAGVMNLKGLKSLSELKEVIRLSSKDPKPWADMISHNVEYQAIDRSGGVDEYREPVGVIESRWGDCDDFVVLNYLWAYSHGKAPGVIDLAYADGQSGHVMVAYKDEAGPEDGKMVVFDNTTVKRFPDEQTMMTELSKSYGKLGPIKSLTEKPV